MAANSVVSDGIRLIHTLMYVLVAYKDEKNQMIKAPQALHNTPPLLGAPKVILWDI